jgi:hypothetical protein
MTGWSRMNTDKLKYRGFEAKGESLRTDLLTLGLFALVPTLRVGTQSEPLCGSGRRSVPHWVTTRSVGTIRSNCCRVDKRSASTKTISMLVDALRLSTLRFSLNLMALTRCVGMRPRCVAPRVIKRETKGETRKAKSGLVNARAFSPFALRLSPFSYFIRIDPWLNSYKLCTGSEL